MPSSPSTIDEDQVFVLRLNGAARPEDLQAGVRCEIQGIHEQVAARRLAGAERTRLLRSIAQVLKDQGEPWDARNPESEATLEVVQCVRTLPANARMVLVWGRGIATPSGQTNPADQRLEFQVRDHFSAHLRCQRENAKAGCMPLLPLRVEFTAPVSRSLLDKISLQDAKGKAYRQRRPEQATATDTSVTFPGPFPASASLTLKLPAALADDKGRALVNAARFPMSFRMADTPPLVKFSGEFEIGRAHV